MNKECPMLMLGMYANSDPDAQFSTQASYCKEEECGWWTGGSCAVLRVTDLLEEIMRRKLCS